MARGEGEREVPIVELKGHGLTANLDSNKKPSNYILSKAFKKQQKHALAGFQQLTGTNSPLQDS